MPENSLPSAPELPGVIPKTENPPPENEQIPTGEPDSENSTFEKIRRAGESVLGQFGIVRRGRGRPRKDGSPKISDVVESGVPISQEQASLVAAPSPAPVYDALFSRSISSMVKGAFSFAKSFVRKKAKQAGMDSGFTENALRECEIEPAVQADFDEALKIVLEKYGAKTEYAPEIALAVATGRMAGPYLLLLQTFNAEIERRKREGK